MNKKYIIYIGGFILPDRNAAAHRVLSNAKIFRELGYQVVLIGVKKMNSYNRTQLFKREIQGFTVYERPYPLKRTSWVHHLTSISFLKKIVKDIEEQNIFSIIAYNPPSIVQIKARNYCNKIHAYFMLDITEWYKANSRDVIFNLLKNTDSNFRMKFLNFKSDGIITISKFLYDYYRKNKNTVLIPPLVDYSEMKWPKTIPVLTETKHFTYIGSPGSSDEKEIFDILFEVFSLLYNDYDFVINIVGVTKDEIAINFPKSREFIDKLGSKIRFLGRLNNKDCISLINKSHFFIFLRRESIVTKAGFPTKFVESISAGTPVLTNKTSNLEDYLIEGKNGFWLNNKNKNELRNQLHYCLQLTNRQVMDMKAHCLKSKLFHYSNFYKNMFVFFNQLNIDNEV